MEPAARRPGLLGRRAALVLAAASLPAPRAFAQAWPAGPVRFVCIFPPGGSTDLLSRIWCQRMSEITGQSFVVDNRGGSGGNVGTEVIARAHPDGTTIGLASVSSLAIAPTLYRRLPFDVNRDLSYICGLWQLPNLLVVRPDLPARTIPELIALCRAEPGRYTFASSGAGTTLHIAGEMFRQMAQVNILHVPYRGGGPAYADLLGGRVDMVFGNFPEASRLHREGKVRGLATTGAARSPQAPDIPAMAERPCRATRSISGAASAGPRASRPPPWCASPCSAARLWRAPRSAAATRKAARPSGGRRRKASPISAATTRRASRR